MDVNITARHCEIPDALRERVAARADRLLRFNERVIALETVFESDAGEHWAEVRVRVAGEEPLVARAAGESFRAAFDRVMDKVVRQARRRRERRRQHQAAKLQA